MAVKYMIFLIVSIPQIYFGYVGIEDWVGNGWAIGAVVIGVLTRLMLPLSVGTLLAVINVYGFEWWFIALVIMPSFFLNVMGGINLYRELR
ncbi:hypothetical protein N9V38_00590 [Planktomarina temperata]|nr:hypothetical protein [Planktomarina temperata]